MRCLQFVCVVVLLSALAGCGTGDSPKSVTPPAATENIKAALNDVAQTGQIGSGGMTIEQEIEKLHATDAAKADALKKDYDELKTIRDPGKAKAKAQEMMGKL